MKQMLKKLSIPEKYFEDSNENESTCKFDSLNRIAEKYVSDNIQSFHLENPTIEGESKKIYAYNKLALVELKPTMYSFTSNRYGIVNGTDNIRLDFWKLFGTFLNRQASKIQPLKEMPNEEFQLVSNYIGEITFSNKRYAIIAFLEEIPAIEVVWKNYMVGTMKHNLKNIDKCKTKNKEVIEYEGRFPGPIVRFDWRNPLPHKDECIPDDFAEFYTDTKAAKKTVMFASNVLNSLLTCNGYELIDLCYFISYDGKLICSEITPDGMRIRKNKDSFDKDLWRLGKDSETICKAWTGLYEDLTRGNEK